MLRLRFQRLGDHFLHLLVADRAWRTGPRFIQQPIQASGNKNRLRRLPTVCIVTRNSRATCWLVQLLSQASTIRDLSASCWLLFGRRAQRSSVCRSSLLKTKSAFGRPRAIRFLLSRKPTRPAVRAQDYFSEFLTQDNSWSLVKTDAMTFGTIDEADEYVKANYRRLSGG